jgi:two-component system, cell cycle response regulator
VRILVADDDAVSLHLMGRILQHSGYEVLTVDNGRQAARELCKSGGPRLALIDWMMPELDGPGVCREVRRRHDDAYVYMLLLTAKQSSGDVVHGLEAGADDYLTKPCHPAELKARLHTGRRILQLEDKLVEAREEMRYKATHDALTSLLNRGSILALLRGELRRATRERSPVSLLLCDLDHFKRINDIYGHLAGDAVLEQVSKRLLNTVRANDDVGRFGGEEFLIVLNGCTSSELRERAEQVLSAINCLPCVTSCGTIPASLSIGAITIDNWDRLLPIEPFLKEADAALYQAKASGRNRVVYAELGAAAAGQLHVPPGLESSISPSTGLLGADLGGDSSSRRSATDGGYRLSEAPRVLI